MPPDWDEVFAIFLQKLYEVSAHAEEKLAERDIAHAEIEQAMANPTLLEDYPADKYGPSCLILGFTAKDRPIHVVLAYPPGVKIITAYVPSLDQWESDYKTRKAKL